VRVLIQRVTRASVSVAGETVGKIGSGFLLLVGITHGDTPELAAQMAQKVANLRIFDDASGNLNRSALDLLTTNDPVGMLVVSQFTLYADTRKGRRPSFVDAARPETAAPLVDHFADALRGLSLPVATGRFGAEMAIDLVNDGPITIWLDSES
jgi:D-tyrosyl-tRNA(Tyr) deacylase